MSGPRNAHSTERGRVYRWKGETFDSVTTIIGKGVPKPNLIDWAAKRAARHAVENHAQIAELVAAGDTKAAVAQIATAHEVERDTAANKGTEVHAHVEAHVLEAPIAPPGLATAKTLDSFKRFCDEMQPEFLMSEATVYSRKYGYAGTLDLICRIVLNDLGTLLIDVKSGKGVYGEAGLQLVAYGNAEFVGMPDDSEVPVPAVDGYAVLHLRPRSYKLVPVKADPTKLFRSFLYAQQVAHFVEYDAGDVFGDPLGQSAPPLAFRAAGVTFADGYPDNLLGLYDVCRQGPLPLEVVRQPDNQYDPNAISLRLNGVHLGHVPKELAAQIAPQIDAGALYAADAVYVAVTDANPRKPGLQVELTKEG